MGQRHWQVHLESTRRDSGYAAVAGKVVVAAVPVGTADRPAFAWWGCAG